MAEGGEERVDWRMVGRNSGKKWPLISGFGSSIISVRLPLPLGAIGHGGGGGPSVFHATASSNGGLGRRPGCDRRAPLAQALMYGLRLQQ